MKKRLISVLLSVIMCLGNCISALALVVEYTEGPRAFEVDFRNATVMKNAYVDSDGKLIMSAGGYVEYDFYIPFEYTAAILLYDVTEEVSLKVDLGQGEQSATAKPMASRVQVGFSGTRAAGDIKVKIASEGNISFGGLIYTKRKESITVTADASAADYTQYTGLNLTPIQDALQTALVIHPNSPVLFVNGAKRYVDYNDVSQKPRIINGSLYLPLKTFAESLGFYYEELYDKSYAMLRLYGIEYVLKDNKLYVAKEGAGYELMQNIMVREGGVTYVPVRYFAEMSGKKVVYKDGYTFVENSENLIKSITETELFDELKVKFEELKKTAEAKTYYVSKATGNDNNIGSESAPFATIQRAADIADAGDTVIIRNGKYYETVTPKNSGTASSPIIFKAEEGAEVIISALEDITSTPTKVDDMYVYDIGWDLGQGRNQIFYKNEALAEARHPNTHTTTSDTVPNEELGLSPLWPTRGNIIVTFDGRAAKSVTDLNQPDDFWKGGTLVSMHGGGWSLGTAEIAASTKGKLMLGNKTNEWWFSGEASLADYAYITGTKNAVDMPGEWYVDHDGKLYIIMPEGETPETINLEAKRRQVTVDLSDRKYVQFVNVSTIGGGIKMMNSDTCVVNGGSHKYLSHYTFTEDSHHGFIEDHNVLDKNGSVFRGEQGIVLYGTDCAIINTDIKYSAAAAIYDTGIYSYIANNNIEECGYMGSYVGGIFILPNFAYSKVTDPRGGHTIVYNTVRKSGRAVFGIATLDTYKIHDFGQYEMLAMDIAYNEFSDGSITARDTGTVYCHGATVGNDRAKTKFHNNAVYNTWVDFGAGYQIYWDNWIHGADCYDNITFANNSENYKIHDDIYIQTPKSFPTSYATIGTWDNSFLGRIDKSFEDITEDEYPRGKKFRVGANSENYSYNYDNLDLKKSYYPASNASKSSKVEINEGFADLKANGEWICFENVNFGNDYNSFEFTYRGDRRNTGDKIDVIIGKSMQEGYIASDDIKIDSASGFDVYTKKIVAPYCEGKTNVYVKANTYKSLEIGALTPIKVSSSELSDIVYAKVYMGDSYVKLSNGVLTKAGPAGGNTKKMIYNTQGESVTAYYQNVEIPLDINSFIISTSTAGTSAGQTIQIRFGSPDAPVAAQIIVPDSGWENYVTTWSKLNTTIKKGTYDVYITFVGKQQSTNAWWFGFQNRDVSIQAN